MLTISDHTIGMRDGLYSLNDLHRVSGGLKRHQPSNFIRKKQTQALITEIYSSSKTRSLEPIRIIGGVQSDSGLQGTFVCRELVYSYAMWISPRFQLLVIHSFDSMTVQQNMLSKHLDNLCKDLKLVSSKLSSAGSFLSIGGKQIKPQLQHSINQTLEQMQLSLELTGGGHIEK